MAKKRIFTVGFDLPGEEFEYISFSSDQTLLDADIVLYMPTLGDYTAREQYAGKSLLTEHSSFVTKRQLDHWKSEIVAAVNAGNVVIVFLAKPVEAFRYTGNQEFSGTGRSRVTTNIVAPISSYESIPKIKTASAKSGSQIRIEKDATYLSSYWHEFSVNSAYEVEIEGDFTRTLLKSKAGDRIVGSAFHGKSGALLLLPPLRYDQKKFERENKKTGETHWTAEALQFGKRLVAALVGLAVGLQSKSGESPPPEWATQSEFRLSAEAILEAEVSECSREISALQSKKVQLQGELSAAGQLRRLLFEQGKPLERAVLEAMTLFGFQGHQVSDGDSEFDGVFESPEGRCLGEVEGRDSKPINIEKFSQLERNLQEDFAREDRTEFAKGVLFGNAHRLAALDKRSDFFTAKCISAAGRTGVALVRTTDMFAPARYLKENPTDQDYAHSCRKAIFDARGAIVTFPLPPLGTATRVAERAT